MRCSPVLCARASPARRRRDRRAPPQRSPRISSSAIVSAYGSPASASGSARPRRSGRDTRPAAIRRSSASPVAGGGPSSATGRLRSVTTSRSPRSTIRRYLLRFWRSSATPTVAMYIKVASRRCESRAAAERIHGSTLEPPVPGSGERSEQDGEWPYRKPSSPPSTCFPSSAPAVRGGARAGAGTARRAASFPGRCPVRAAPWSPCLGGRDAPPPDCRLQSHR